MRLKVEDDGDLDLDAVVVGARLVSGAEVGAADLLVGAGVDEEVAQDTTDGNDTLELATEVGALAAVDVAIVAVASMASMAYISWGGSGSAADSRDDGGDDLGDLHIGGWSV